jgi:hypothetical protein
VPHLPGPPPKPLAWRLYSFAHRNRGAAVLAATSAVTALYLSVAHSTFGLLVVISLLTLSAAVCWLMDQGLSEAGGQALGHDGVAVLAVLWVAVVALVLWAPWH